MVHLFQAFRKVAVADQLNMPLKISENSRTSVNCIIKADSNNTSDVLIGGHDCDKNGYPLEAGEKLSDVVIPILDEIYVSFATAGDKIYILVYEDPHVHAIREAIFQSFGQEYMGKQNPKKGH